MRANVTELPTKADPEIDLAGLQPVETIRRRWPMILAAALTVAMIVGLARELFGSGLAGLTRTVPADPRFYICFALLYLAAPIGDFAIYRRLWGIRWAGFAALNKKRIANDVVLGYSGEAYFYAWARARARVVAAPFGAIKDVTLLSAVAGNGATILLCLIALPLGYQLISPPILRTMIVSAMLTIAISVVILALSRRIFSLPRGDLWVIFAIHCARIAAGSILLAFAWHFAMPSVPIGMWLFLSAGRLLVLRLPLVPNKDLLFANFAILLIGQDRALSEMIAFTAALTLLVHAILIGAFSATDLAKRTWAWAGVGRGG